MFHTIALPELVVFAENDEIADRRIEKIKEVFDAHTGSKNYTSVIIPDATHEHEGKQQEFVHTVVEWAAGL